MTTGGHCRTSETRYHQNRKFLSLPPPVERPLGAKRRSRQGRDRRTISARSEVVPHPVQLFRSNWLRSLSAIDWIMSHRSTSCGPSVMITTFQESSCGTMEMARPVGHSQMSSISSLIADSSSSRVFAGFFKLFFHRAERDHAFRASALFLNSGREPFTLRYRRRTQTAGGGPTSQRLCRDNVPTAGCFAAAAASQDGSIASVYLRPCDPGDRMLRWHPRQ